MLAPFFARRRRSILAVLVCVIAFGAAAEARAEPVLRALEMLPDPVGLASRAEYAVELEGLEDLEASTTLLLLLPDGTFEAERRKVEREPDGFYWAGRVRQGWDVMLTVHDGVLSGLVYTPWRTYELIPGVEETRLADLDGAAFPACATEDPGAESVPDSSSAGGSFPGTGGGGGSVIMDILVVYTPQARDGVGGVAQIESVIRSAVNITNTAYENSQVDARIQLIHVAEAPFSDSGSSSTDLSNVRTSTAVHVLRDRYGADLVSLIVDSNGSCGRGYLQRNPGPGFERLGYQVTRRSCAVGNLSFAHEFGHNQGCEHDPANGGSPANASFPYAFGHYHSGSYRTVMSYSNQCSGGCSRAPYVSNSNVQNNGLDTGILDQRENYRTINNTAGIISDFRPSAVSLNLSRSEYRVREDAGFVVVEVDRFGIGDVDVTACVIAESGTATVGLDFAAVTTTITWAAGDTTTRSVQIPILDDVLVEGLEYFDVVLTELRGAGTGTVGVARITIDDLENGLVEVGVTERDVREDEAMVTIEVRRAGGSNGDIAVAYQTVADSATDGADYEGVSGRLTWLDGDASARAIDVVLRDDGLVEGPERFRFELSDVTGGGQLGNAAVDVTIQDWEEGFVSFESATFEVDENAGEAILRLTRSDGSDPEVTVGLAFAAGPNGAEPAVDFTAIETSAVFGPGAATAAVAVPILDDRLVEGDETFIAQIITVSGNAGFGAQLRAEITIRDYEEGAVQFASADLAVPEDAGQGTIVVSRVDGASGPVSARYDLTEIAAEIGVDFTIDARSGVLEWEDEDATDRTISFDLVDDDRLEGAETFVVRLSDPELGVIGDPALIVVTIDDREAGAVAPISTSFVTSEDAGVVQLRVVRERGSRGGIEIPWRLEAGTAVPGTDYEDANGTLRWEDGEDGVRTVDVTILEDDEGEDNERFALVLGPAPDGVELQEEAMEITITDSGGGEVSFVEVPAKVDEGVGTLRLRLERTGETNGRLDVTVLAEDGSAQADVDFDALEERVSWSNGESGVREIALAILDDDTVEEDETFRLRQEAQREDVALADAITLTLVDDDRPPKDEGGCSCSSTKTRSGTWTLLLLAIPTFARRRRR